jgi:predicted Zn-dependent protease
LVTQRERGEQRLRALIETATTFLTPGETQNSLTAAKRAQEILKALLVKQPDNTSFQHELSVARQSVGNAQLAQRNPEDALTSYREDIAFTSRLAQSDPNNTDWQSDISSSYKKVGDVQVAQGNFAVGRSLNITPSPML